MKLDRKTAITALEEIALLLELKGENPFKIRAYSNASRALNSMDGDVGAILASGELAETKGFGKALIEKLSELAETGELEFLDKLRAEFPESLLEMMRIPSVGPKKVKQFYEKLNISSVGELEKACRDGRIAELPGLGKKTADKILYSIARMRESAGFFLFTEARGAAETVAAEMRTLPQVQRLEIAGSLRRFKEFTKDADIIASSDDPKTVMEHFVNLSDVEVVQAHGETKSSILLKNGMQVDLRLVSDDTFPYALHHFTGSKDHNVAIRSRALKEGMKVSEWGLFRVGDGDEQELIPCMDEAALFEQLGLRQIPPELRENLGEIEHAESADFPKLVETADYKGVLHCHTHASDGADSIEELVAFAKNQGHEYLGITDHSRSSFQANGLDEERLYTQVERIESIRNEMASGFELFAGVECDIRPDGALDYEDDILERLDFFVVSVHSAFTQSQADMTTRVIKAIEHPGSRILAHPSGRLLLKRDAYEIDMQKIIDAAAANRVAIEFNCNPQRLDMDWRLWRSARDKGVLCSLNPDAHRLVQFDYVTDGIGFCRKGWLTADDIINCWPAVKVRKFFEG